MDLRNNDEEDDFFGSQQEKEQLDIRTTKHCGKYNNDGTAVAVVDKEEGVFFFSSSSSSSSSSSNYHNNINNYDEFGSLMQKERSAKELELKTVAFLDAFDEYKESRVQEGFEYGMIESLDVAIRIGKLLGKQTTVQNLTGHVVVGSGNSGHGGDKDNDDHQVVNGIEKNSSDKQRKIIDQAKAVTRNFFSNKFQMDDNSTTTYGTDNCQEELQRIEDLLKTLLLDQVGVSSSQRL
jgi:hypothetical protein